MCSNELGIESSAGKSNLFWLQLGELYVRADSNSLEPDVNYIEKLFLHIKNIPKSIIEQNGYQLQNTLMLKAYLHSGKLKSAFDWYNETLSSTTSTDADLLILFYLYVDIIPSFNSLLAAGIILPKQ